MKHYLIVLITLSAFSNVFAQGLILNKESYQKAEQYVIPKQFGFSESDLPLSISYRKYCPSPKNQGAVKTCVGWAAAYGALSAQQNIAMGITDENQKWARAFDPNFIYNFIKDDRDNWCDNGTTLVDALNTLENYGTKPMIWEPWLSCKDNKAFNEFTKALASNYKIEDWRPVKEEGLVTNIKTLLYSKMPVIVGVNLTESFVSGSSLTYGYWNPKLGETAIGGHAMTVVGYNDAKFGGAFELMNSYGSDFGDSGFIWIRYSDFIKSVGESYVMFLPKLSKEACSMGDCENSYSRFKFETGEVYEGIIKNSQIDIYGSYLYADGSLYIGEFKAGRKHGWGLLYSEKLQTYYTVYYQNDKLAKYEEKGFAKSEEEKKSLNKIQELKKQITGTIDDKIDFETLQKNLEYIEAPDKPVSIPKK